MDVVMDIAELGGILSEFVQAGYAQAVKAYDVTKDRVRRTAVSDWLRYNSYDVRVFEALERRGMIKSFRVGEGRNSPLYYSKEEIKRAFAYVKVKRVIDGKYLCHDEG